MLQVMLLIALIILSFSVLTGLVRVLLGPSMPDRIIALDTIGINLIGIVAILSVMQRTQTYLEIILLIGIVAFLGTIAFSKYIEKGAVIEHERSDR
ncbi:Na(+)/H(+) antiporter subunit F1 [Paenibacillus sambharensis]|uniref:Na(+)/H(+) antiporter subunit F1 n=1 Tax=Paenibacillus sambharensis TaxID=1803190 RepID=A0A2W1LMP3_9BACL|nr:Na(+)/H(+) antiporter subunit F1 [Paenibacillus sambharensis]PZD96155.1 Na(+)/H(+) antiporter subunit F1 [Paenibacillus sambharensis]